MWRPWNKPKEIDPITSLELRTMEAIAFKDIEALGKITIESSLRMQALNPEKPRFVYEFRILDRVLDESIQARRQIVGETIQGLRLLEQGV